MTDHAHRGATGAQPMTHWVMETITHEVTETITHYRRKPSPMTDGNHHPERDTKTTYAETPAFAVTSPRVIHNRHDRRR